MLCNLVCLKVCAELMIDINDTCENKCKTTKDFYQVSDYCIKMKMFGILNKTNVVNTQTQDVAFD